MPRGAEHFKETGAKLRRHLKSHRPKLENTCKEAGIKEALSMARLGRL